MKNFELGELEPVELGNSSLLLRKIRSGNAFEETVERLLQTIRLGLASPGDRLPGERELAALLDVSRDTIRDATASLAEAGYLSIRRGRYGGTFVAEKLPLEKTTQTISANLKSKTFWFSEKWLSVARHTPLPEPSSVKR